jgi:hypothetical protein
MIFSPNQNFILDGTNLYRNFLYDYQKGVPLRVTLIFAASSLNAYKYITTHIIAPSKPGFT